MKLPGAMLEGLASPTGTGSYLGMRCALADSVRSGYVSSNSEMALRYACSSLAPPLRSSRWISSRCCENSSTRSDSAVGSRRSRAIRSWTIRFQSCMFNSCNPTHGRDEFLPALSLRAKDFSTFGGQAVITPSSLLGLFHPTACDPAPILEPVQQRIKGGDMKPQNTARSDLDQL